MLATETRGKIARAFDDPDTIGTCLIAMLLDRYGTEWLNWEFETIRLELTEDWGVKLPNGNADKIQALMTVLTTDQFFRDPLIFGHICTALVNEPVNFEVAEGTSPDAMAWGVFEVASLLGKDISEFTTEVRRYIGFCLNQAGMQRPPQVLKPVADYPDDGGDAAIQSVADDPIMFNAAHEHAQSSIADVDQFVGQRFGQLIRQLSALHLESRDHQQWAKLLEQLRKKGQIQ